MRISYKTLSYLVLGALMVFSAIYYLNVNSGGGIRPAYGQGAAIGPEYFPNVLAVLLFVLSLLSLYRTSRMEDRKLDVPHIGLILLAIGVTGLFVGGWYLTGWFFPLAFLFVSVLLYAYRREPGRHVFAATTSVAIALVLTGAIYFVFARVMSLRF